MVKYIKLGRFAVAYDDTRPAPRLDPDKPSSPPTAVPSERKLFAIYVAKTIGIAVAGLLGFVALLFVIASIKGPADENSSESTAIAQNERQDRTGNLVGTWIGAGSGGEDGKTVCDEAATNAAFLRRQGNKLGLMKYDASGQFVQVFMDEALDSQLKASGNWIFENDAIVLRFSTAGLGKLGDDTNNLRRQPNMEGTSLRMDVRFDGFNVMFQTNPETGVTNRLVRCI